MADLHSLTAVEAARAIRAGRLTATALTEACLDRIAAREPAVEAWQAIDRDKALAAAQAADLATPHSPLHGVPFGVKDVIDTADLPTTYGTAIYEGHQPARDAACVARMKQAGAVLLGKTVSTEFATFRPGKTRNPHDPAHTPGGSSSGSAAAVGDGMVPLAFGNQTAGSLIRPAAYCGVVGFKPTHGTVDLAGILPLEPALDTLGYMARCVEDVATFYAVVRGTAPTALDTDTAPHIGVLNSFQAEHWQPESRKAVADAAKRLSADGAAVADTALPASFADLPDTHRIVLNRGLTRTVGEEERKHGNRISEQLRAMIADGRAITPAEAEKALAHAEACRVAIHAAFGDNDVFLCPSAPGIAPEGLGATGNPIFQIVWTLLHMPCITLPVAKGPKGLPVGIQLIGRPGDDARLLRTARWVERRLIG